MGKCHIINELLKIVYKEGGTSTVSLSEQLDLKIRNLQNHLKKLSSSTCLDVHNNVSYSKEKLDIESIQGKSVCYKLNPIFKSTLKKFNSKERNNILYIVSAIHFCEDLHYYSNEHKINFLFNLLNYSIQELHDSSYVLSTNMEVEDLNLKKYNLYYLDINSNLHPINKPLMLYFHSIYTRNNTIYFLFYDQNIQFEFIKKKDIHTFNIANASPETQTYKEIDSEKVKYFLHKENLFFDIKNKIKIKIDNTLLKSLNKDFFNITINSFAQTTTIITMKESYNFLFPFLKMNIDKITIIEGDSTLIEDLKEYFHQDLYAHVANIKT